MKATLHLNPFHAYPGDGYGGSYGSLVSNASTPVTFTPTTMKSLAQLLEGQQGHEEHRGQVGPSSNVFLDSKRPLANSYSGGSAVVVVKEENPYDLQDYPDIVFKEEIVSDDFEEDRSEDHSDDDYEPVPVRAVRASRNDRAGRRGTKRPANTRPGPQLSKAKRRGNVKNDYDGLPPGDREKLFQRRERNKQAAARCRQRREDLTQSLMDQVKAGDASRAALEKEIQGLRVEKRRLEELLREHEAGCHLRGTVAVKLESGATSTADPLRTSPLVRRGRPASLCLPPSTYSPPPDVTVETPSHGLSFDTLLSSNSGFTPLLALNSPPAFGPGPGGLVTPCAVQQRSCESADLNTPSESASLVSL